MEIAFFYLIIKGNNILRHPRSSSKGGKSLQSFLEMKASHHTFFLSYFKGDKAFILRMGHQCVIIGFLIRSLLIKAHLLVSTYSWDRFRSSAPLCFDRGQILTNHIWWPILGIGHQYFSPRKSFIETRWVHTWTHKHLSRWIHLEVDIHVSGLLVYSLEWV